MEAHRGQASNFWRPVLMCCMSVAALCCRSDSLVMCLSIHRANLPGHIYAGAGTALSLRTYSTYD